MSRSRTADDSNDEFDRILESEIRRSNARINKKKIETETRELTKEVTSYFYFTNKAISDFARFLSVLTFLNDSFTQFLRAVLPWASVVTMIFSYLLKMVTAACISNESTPTRIVKIIAATAGLGLGITAIVMAATTIAITAMVIDLAHKFWEIGDLTYQRFRGGWKQKREVISKLKDKLTQSHENYTLVNAAYDKANKAAEPDKRLLDDLQYQLNEIKCHTFNLHKRITNKENKERVRNLKLANCIHTAATSTVVLVGFILTLIPVTAPIGAAILVGTAIYCALDTFDINPFRYVANKLFRDPFGEKAPMTSFEKLKIDLDNKSTLANAKKLALPVANNFNDSTKKIYASIDSPPAKVTEMDPNSVENDKTYPVKKRYEPDYVNNYIQPEPATKTPDSRQNVVAFTPIVR